MSAAAATAANDLVKTMRIIGPSYETEDEETLNAPRNFPWRRSWRVATLGSVAGALGVLRALRPAEIVRET